MKIVARITNREVEKHWGKIKTDVVLTDERILHICEGHESDYCAFGECIGQTIEEPNYILEDSKNANTAMFIKHIEATNINVIVRLALKSMDTDLQSSVITMYRLGEKTLKRLLKNNTAIYRNHEL